MARHCVFCGSNHQLTKEHGLPVWIDGFISTTGIDRTFIGDDHLPRFRGRSRTISGHEIRAVCKTCNGGWMSTLEDQSKPLIGPMIMGHETPLSKDAQTIVATWVIKTCLVNALGGPKSDSTNVRELCEDLYRERKPLEHFPVMIGARVVDKWPVIHHFQRLALSSVNESGDVIGTPLEAHFSTVAIGHFVAQALFVPHDDFVFTIGGPDHGMRVIWPYGGDFTWPPGPYLTSDEVEQLARTDLPINPDETLPESNEPWQKAEPPECYTSNA